MSHDFQIRTLGDRVFDSNLDSKIFIDESTSILLDAKVSNNSKLSSSPTVLEQAGARKKLFFDPKTVRAAIVTCGGLCPGLNDVIRGITMVLWYRYGVREILGLRYGYEGMIESYGNPPLHLTPDIVEDIHQDGGTILGSSRGQQDVGESVDFLSKNNINMLFTIGGDGTQKGTLDLSDEIKRRGLKIAVVGIPKTIDNDIAWTTRTFGFKTAVAMSQVPITCAHMEAKGARNGVGIVKLMGRESGFVATYATLASSDVNLVLLPEIEFKMTKLLSWLDARLERKSHAVIVVAEGAGQNFVATDGRDASGNKKLGDIGTYLKQEIASHFKEKGSRSSVKYIDPSYIIRSAPASADDSVFCFQLAEKAVHAAMSGRTRMVVGLWNGYFVHIPVEKAVESRKKIDPSGLLWQSILDNTGQPDLR